MQNNFPRIYSMSTIGIKQHFNCDYLFHPNRTDFSGESGSGKSMVADMIQLILVGSRVYKSSTDSNKTRDPKGMVLEPKGKQQGIGYVLLNIQTHDNKYIVLGAYIESSHNKVQAFIIQEGYDWDEQLTPLSSPVFYRDLLVDEKIQPIGSLESQLSEMRLKQLSWKKYHQLLYTNELLALDLNKDKTLESFASILRSFSRGKGFKTDSASLKKFLFGDDDQNKLIQKYQEEVQAINNDFHEHQRYMSEIKLINDKQEQVAAIVGLNNDYEDKKREYFTSKNWYWKRLYNKYENDLKEAAELFKVSKCKQVLLAKKEADLEIESLHNLRQLKQNLNELEEAKNLSAKSVEEINEKFDKAKEDKAVIDKVENWLSGNDNSLDNVKKWYQSERGKVSQKETLQRFIKHMEAKGQLGAFESSAWCTDFEQQRSNFVLQQAKMEEQLKKLGALSVFSNLDDPDSLAAWAKDNLSFPVTHEEESLLVHFQTLPRREPDPVSNTRYLPFPNELFDAPQIKQKTKKGFWINLDGVHEYIEYTKDRLLNSTDVESLFAQLYELNTGLKERIKNLENQFETNTNLKEALDGFGGIEEAVKLYREKDNLLAYIPKNIALLPQDEFNRHLELYADADRIRKNFVSAKSAYEENLKKQSAKELKIKEVQGKIDQILEHFSTSDLSDNEIGAQIQQRKTDVSSAKAEIKNLLDEIKVEEIEKSIFPEKIGLTKVLQLKADNASNYAGIKNKKEDLEQKLTYAKNALQQSGQDYLTTFKKEFQFTNAQHVENNPDEGDNNLKDQYKKAEAAFQAKYNVIKESIDDKTQLDDYSVGMLAHKLLPTVFESSRIDKNLIEERIAERLNKLTRDIQEIGSRKVEILKRVFSEVHKTYNEYLEKIQGIDTYLKKNNHGITGGNRASLKYRKSIDYPDKWMAPFRKQLDEAVMNVGLFEDLKKEVDINKMMLKAFQTAGGSSKVTWEDLLNPKSYFDLDFDLKLESGESNAGSQGQTYTANALLGLARLSLIETEKRKGLRIMPIDEAEGLGSNYNMLHELAKQENYQIVSMSIETAGDIVAGEQYIYIMNENNLADESSYVPPLGIFTDGDPVEDIESFIHPNTQEE